MQRSSDHPLLPPKKRRFEDREIARLIRHLRWYDATQRLVQGVLIALALNLIAAFTARLLPLWHRETLVYTLFWSVGIRALLAGLIGGFWPSPLPSRLRRLDLGLRLADRLTTLWELSKGGIAAPPALRHAQREETLHYLLSVDPSKAFPLHPRRRAGFILLFLSLLLAPLLLLPNPQEVELARREAQAQARQEALARMEQLAETLTESPTLTEAQREAALQALNDALTTLRTPDASAAEQQLALTKMEQQLAALRLPDNEAADTSKILRVAEAAASASRSRSVEDASVVNPLTEAIQREDLEAAAAYLRALTDPEGEALSAEEILALADTFNALADNLQNTDPTLAEQFRQIAQEMYTQDANGAREALQQASDTLSQIAQASARDQTLEQAQAQVQSAREQLRQSQSRPGPVQQTGEGRSPLSPGQSRPSGAADSSRQTGGTSKQGQHPGIQGSHEDSGSSAPYNPDYAAPRLDNQGDQITIPRPVEYQSDPQVANGQQPLARPRGTGSIPYQEVYADYAEAAEAQLSRQAYPPGLRAYIQMYFSTLEK